MSKSLRHCEACAQAVAIYHSTKIDSHGRYRSLGMNVFGYAVVAGI